MKTKYIHYFRAPHYQELFRSKEYETHRDAVSALWDMQDGLQNIVIDVGHAESVIMREAWPEDSEELDEQMCDLENDLTYEWTMSESGPYKITSHEVAEYRNEYEDQPGFFTSLIQGDMCSAGRRL